MVEKNSLFTPIKIGNRTVPNRIVINAMECCDSDSEGNASERTHQRYRNYLWQANQLTWLA